MKALEKCNKIVSCDHLSKYFFKDDLNKKGLVSWKIVNHIVNMKAVILV